MVSGAGERRLWNQMGRLKTTSGGGEIYTDSGLMAPERTVASCCPPTRKKMHVWRGMQSRISLECLLTVNPLALISSTMKILPWHADLHRANFLKKCLGIIKYYLLLNKL